MFNRNRVGRMSVRSKPDMAQRVFFVFFGLVSIWVIICFVAIAFMLSRAFIVMEDISDVGARSVLERIWCGKDTNCRLLSSHE